ncbi:sensor histidine kinase [Paenibacillus tarimensis]|uniref:sensor histidine kinase n=2 Tax=Paenibacillus tarimensis TaxID=416012 RepID=UPI0038B32833
MAAAGVTIMLLQYLLGAAGADEAALVQAEERYAFGYFTGFLLLTLFFFHLLAGRMIARIEQLHTYVEQMKQGDLSIRIPAGPADEIGKLAGHIHDMAGSLKTMREKERASERAKNEMIAGLSHDLRTPLTSLSGYLELLDKKLQEQSADDEIRRPVGIARRKCAEMSELLEELTDFSSLADALPVQAKQLLSIRELVEQVLVDHIPQMERADMSYTIQERTAGIMIIADPSLMARLLDNLISNAVRYGKDGKRIVIDLDGTKGELVISVTSYGNPIPAEALPRLFERFYRVDPSRSRKHGGRGLGLAICKHITELHNGSIEASSGPEGTTFTVRLTRAADGRVKDRQQNGSVV